MENRVHLYKMSYWKFNKTWHVNDVKNLAGRSAKWYTPMRILDVSVEEYLNLLLKFNAVNIKYYDSSDYLAFCFLKEKDAKAFCSYINKIAKQKNYYCS